MISALGLLAVALGAQDVVTADGSVREEIRAGTAVSVTGLPNDIGFNEVLTPSLAAAWTDHQNRVYLLYDPELQVPDLGTGNHLQILHRGNFEYDWKDRSGAQGFTFAEALQYGLIDLFGLTPSVSGVTSGSALAPPPIVLQPIPVVTRLQYESSYSVIALHLAPFSRGTLDFRTGYTLNGGATPAARLSLPLQQGPFGSASLQYRPTKTEVLTTRISLTDLLFSDGPRTVLLDVVEIVDSHLAEHLVGTIGGGLAGLRSQVPHLPPVNSGFPEAQGSLTETLALYRHGELKAGFSAIMAPLVDRLGGNAYESLQLLGTLEWALIQDVSLRGLAGISDPLYGNLGAAQRTSVVQGAVGYQPAKFLMLQAGFVSTHQEGLTGGSGSQWLAFVGFLLHETTTTAESN